MLIMCLLTTASAFKSVPPTNIARFDSFGAARDVLSSKESKVNTFAVEQAAAAVPADAWTNVAPAEVWLTLPSPDDASATRKLLREGLCTSLRGPVGRPRGDVGRDDRGAERRLRKVL